MSDSELRHANDQVKKLNRYLIGLVAFACVYVMVMLTMIAKKQEDILTNHTPFVQVDPITLSTPNTNIIHPDLRHYATSGAYTVQQLMKDMPETNGTVVLPYRPMFKRKDNYDVGDYVIISYFHVQGIVLEKEADKVVVMYRDQNRTLQVVKVPKSFLMIPTSNYAIDPLALLLD